MKQRGMALFQVLLLSVLLGIILMSMNHQARQHTKLAQAVQKYTQAAMALQSAEAQILFNLLSHEPFELAQGVLSEAPGWNFYGVPFKYDSLDVVIQDTSGLLNTSKPDPRILDQLITRVTGSAGLGTKIYAALNDWQDKDDLPRRDGAEQQDYELIAVRNWPLQYSEEWLFIKGMTPEVYRELAPLMSLFTQGVNVNQQPETLWRLYLEENQVSELSRLRTQGKLTPDLFESLTNMKIDEYTRFSYGPSYRIGFGVQNDQVKLTRELTLRLMHYQTKPFDIFEYRLRNLPTDNF